MLFLILLGFATLATSTATCYYPNGKISGSVLCNSTTTGYSSCCASDHLCMSSVLCFNRGLISRGSCTDPTWKDAACAQYCLDWNSDSGCAIAPHSWVTVGVVDIMRWCCDLPLANGSCAQGFDINVQAGTVLENSTVGDGNEVYADNCEPSHDVVVGVGVGIPALVAIASLLFLYMRKRGARRKEIKQQESLTSDGTPWIKPGAQGHSFTTITNNEPPWIANRVEAYSGPNVPQSNGMIYQREKSFLRDSNEKPPRMHKLLKIFQMQF